MKVLWRAFRIFICTMAIMASSQHASLCANKEVGETVPQSLNVYEKGEPISAVCSSKGLVTIIADETEYDPDEKTYFGVGNVVLAIGGQDSKLEADTILYDSAKQTIDARGSVRITRGREVTTGSAFRFQITSDEYLVTDVDVKMSGTKIVARLAEGSHTGRILRDRTVSRSGSTYNAEVSFIAPSLTPQFAQHLWGGMFGNGVRGSSSFTSMGRGSTMLMGTFELRRKMHLPGDNVVNTMPGNYGCTPWIDFGQAAGSSNKVIGRTGLAVPNRVGATSGSLIPLGVAGVLRSHKTFTPVGDFPTRGAGYRDGMPVREKPYIPSHVESALNGELPWVY